MPLDRSAMDAKSVQIAMADLVEIQKALLDGMSQGPIHEQHWSQTSSTTSAVLEMAGRVVASTTESIQRRCKEMSQAAKQVIRACDLHSERPQISCPLCTGRSRWSKRHSMQSMHRTYMKLRQCILVSSEATTSKTLQSTRKATDQLVC